jgi:hypothetical protein
MGTHSFSCSFNVGILWLKSLSERNELFYFVKKAEINLLARKKRFRTRVFRTKVKEKEEKLSFKNFGQEVGALKKAKVCLLELGTRKMYIHTKLTLNFNELNFKNYLPM